MKGKPFLLQTFCLIFGLLFTVSCANKPSVVWTEGETDPETGLAVHTLTVLNAPECEKTIKAVREKVNSIMKDYPLFAW